MEDRYLFRGKRTPSSEWIYWDCFTGVRPNTVIDDETICQCTGLKDKTGKLIWENDIMEACLDEDFPENMTRVIVQWNGSGWATHQAGSIVDEYLDEFDTEHFAVISNKFDNPELLV